MVTATVDWGRATTVGALAGGAFWAVAVYALIVSEGSPAVWTAICVLVATLLGAGVVAYRRRTSASHRCFAVGTILVPFVGLVPAAVFGLAGVVAKVVASL